MKSGVQRDKIAVLPASAVQYSRYRSEHGMKVDLEDETAGAGFSQLAILTFLFAWKGWSTAIRRQFVRHRGWMWRCYLLLCSAVTLRAIGGMALLLNQDPAWTYPMAAWISWLGPICIFECGQRLRGWQR